MFLFGRKVDEDLFEPLGELAADSGQFYRRTLEEFDNIKDFMNTYYPQNTLLIPLVSDIQAILGTDGWEDSNNIPSDLEIDYELAEAAINESDDIPYSDKDERLKELYRTTYDYRLVNPYIIRNEELLPINVKMLGNKMIRGLISKICDIMEWLDDQISKVPFNWAEKQVKYFQAKYDKVLSTNSGNIMRTVVWLPLYSVCNTDAVCITIINRIDIIIT